VPEGLGRGIFSLTTMDPCRKKKRVFEVYVLQRAWGGLREKNRKGRHRSPRPLLRPQRLPWSGKIKDSASRKEKREPIKFGGWIETSLRGGQKMKEGEKVDDCQVNVGQEGNRKRKRFHLCNGRQPLVTVKKSAKMRVSQNLAPSIYSNRK